MLDELIQTRNAQAQEYEIYLQQIVELSKQVSQPSNSSQYPESLKTPAQIALYDNLNQNETLALAIDGAIRDSKRDGWRGNKIKERQVKNAIKNAMQKYLNSPEELEEIFAMVKNQSEY